MEERRGVKVGPEILWCIYFPGDYSRVWALLMRKRYAPNVSHVGATVTQVVHLSEGWWFDPRPWQSTC